LHYTPNSDGALDLIPGGQGYDTAGAAIEGATRTFISAGAPASIMLTADRAAYTADRNDLVFVTATAVDSRGMRVPYFNESITFAREAERVLRAMALPESGAADSANNNAELIAVGSGSPTDRSATMGAASRAAFNGRVVGVYRPTKGAVAPFTVTITAAAGQLRSNSLVVHFQEVL
jgi:hypothetical protein